VHWPTLVLGVVLAVALQVLLTRTPLGYELRVVGASPRAARYAGMPIPRVVLLTGLLSGGAAGLAGVGEVAGIHYRLLDPSQISLGYGFTAIIVAWLARGHPALVLLTAPLMGLLLAGGDLLKISLNMPFRVIDVFSGLMLMCLIAGESLARYRLRWG
jgi:simple sugar transport system permease protein